MYLEAKPRRSIGPPPLCLLAPLLLACLLFVSCSAKEPGEGAEVDQTASDTESTAENNEPAQPIPAWSLAIHGGAGTPERGSIDVAAYEQALGEALRVGAELLEQGAAAIEAVEQTVRVLEDDPRFNAARGAVFTNRGTHELDAAIMDGRTLSCGSVAGIKNVRNPITLARRVMERSPHVMLAGTGADQYAREVDVRRVQQQYFYTQERYDAWRQVVRESTRGNPAPAGSAFGTVGAVARDQYGNLAAATSTGGTTNKRFGRVGDVPIIGAGTYAKNATAAISCTGKGEQFIRHTVAHSVSARMEYGGLSLQEAVDQVIDQELNEGDGGLIAVSAKGEIVMRFNTPGMFRGAADAEGRFEVGIWEGIL